jgi:hypothetical protein
MLVRTGPGLARALALTTLAVAGLVFAAACGSGGDSEASKDAAILNAVNIMDNAGLHEMDEAINDDKEIPANARTTAQQLQAITNLTEWPDELESQAEALAAIFGEFAAAIEGDSPDIVKAAEASKRAHDAQHDFSHEVWKYLYEKGGVETGAAGGH